MSVEIHSFRYGERPWFKQFLTLPKELYRDDPYFVPELLLERNDFHNPKKHALRRSMDITYFLALKNGRPVGRITAHSYPAHNEKFGDLVGFFGFFEAVDDVDVAQALFDATAERLRELGFDTMRGPMNFSTNEEFGTLIEAKRPRPPAIMMTHTAPYHPSLYEACEFAKAKDVLAFDVEKSSWPNPKIQRFAKLAREKLGASVRPVSLSKKDWPAERALVNDIYRRAWEDNWGFVPLTDEEFGEMADELRAVIIPELCMIAEVKGTPVGWALTLPDIHELLRHTGGRLLPTAWHLFVRGTHRKLPRIVKRARILALGLLPEYRRRGIEAMFYETNYEYLIGHGCDDSEMGWVLEDNAEMLNGARMMGGEHSKTWRIWEKAL